MFNVSETIKEKLKQDSTFKQLQVTILSTGEVIPQKNIVFESFQYSAALWDGEEFNFGGCNAAEVKFKTLEFDKELTGEKIKVEIVVPDLSGFLYDNQKKQIIDVNGDYITTDGGYTSKYSGAEMQEFITAVGETATPTVTESTVIPIGVFVVDSNETADNGGIVRQVIAYDQLYSGIKINAKPYIDEMTKSYFYPSAYDVIRVMLEKLGINCSINMESKMPINPLLNFRVPQFTNEDPNTNITDEDCACLTILRDVCAACGCWGYINRNGEFDVITVPSAVAEIYTKSLIRYNEIKTSDIVLPEQVASTYYPYKPGKVTIGRYPTGDLLDRVLFFGRNIVFRARDTSDTATQLQQTIYNEIQKIPKTGAETTVKGLPYLDIGDIIKLDGKNVLINSLEFSGIVGMKAKITTQFKTAYEKYVETTFWQTGEMFTNGNV